MGTATAVAAPFELMFDPLRSCAQATLLDPYPPPRVDRQRTALLETPARRSVSARDCVRNPLRPETACRGASAPPPGVVSHGRRSAGRAAPPVASSPTTLVSG